MSEKKVPARAASDAENRANVSEPPNEGSCRLVYRHSVKESMRPEGSVGTLVAVERFLGGKWVPVDDCGQPIP